MIEPTSTEQTALINPDPEAVNPSLPWTGNRRNHNKHAEYVDGKSGFSHCCSACNGLLKAAVLVVSVLMFGSAIVHGMGTQDFPPTEDGGFIQIDDNVRVYFKCEGIKNGTEAR